MTRTVTYYPAGGAMRINSTLYYILKDHLGSASVVTNSTGVVVGEQRYYPYGETRFTTGTIYTDRLFTGQQEITGLGIYNYGARFYSPKLGRFLSADTIVPGATNPQDLNRYSYVRNNPLRYVDPSGHLPHDCGPDNIYCGGLPENGGVSLPIPGSGNNSGDDGGGGGGGGNCHNDPDCMFGGAGGNGGSGGSGGSGGCGQPGYYSPHCPGWHFYTTTNLVCPAELHCTLEEMKDYLLRFQYPGQDPSEPVIGGHTYSVHWPIPFIDISMGSLGEIKVTVSNDGLTTTNTTNPGHILYDGQVKRHLYQGESGAWYVSTYGFGNNKIYTVPVQYGQLEPESVQMSLSSMNQSVGLASFNNLDQQMLINIEAHH